MKRKILTILLTVCMIVGMLPLTALAAGNTLIVGGASPSDLSYTATVAGLNAAFLASQDGDTVQLAENITDGTDSVSLSGTKNVTFDLGTYTLDITNNQGFGVNNGATLNIMGSDTGKIKSTNYTVSLFNGTLNLKSGTIETTKAYSSAVMLNDENCSFTMNGGTINGNPGTAISLSTGSTATINAGTITTQDAGEGAIYGNGYTGSESGGTVNLILNGGSITASGSGNAGNAIHMTGGNMNCVISDSATINGTLPTIGTLTPSLTAGDGKVTLAPQTVESGYKFYYKSTSSTDVANKPQMYKKYVSGYTEYSADTDISTSTSIYVQVIKVNSNSGIVSWGEASYVPPAVDKTISQSLDFTKPTPPSDCSASPIGHTHDGDKCFTWTSSAEGNKLVLNNIKLVSPDVGSYDGESSAIIIPANTTIELIGNNEITGGKATYSHGLRGYDITISGSGTLTATTKESQYSYAIMSGLLTISDGTVNAIANAGTYGYGIYATNNIILNGGTLNVNGGNGIVRNSIYFNNTYSHKITVSNDAGFESKGNPALNSAPAYDTSTHAITVSTDESGTPTTTYDSEQIDTYKYIKISPKTAYTITFNANGGSVTPSSTATDINGKLASLPTPTKSGSYRFDGWFTSSSGGTEITTSTVFTGNDTIYAHWTYTDGNSGGGGGSSSGSNISSDIKIIPPSSDNPNAPTQGEIKIYGSKDGNGNTNASITDKNINDVIKKAEDTAKKNDDLDNGINIVLKLDNNQTTNNITVNLPKTVQETIINKEILNTIILVNNPDVKISMNLDTIKDINKQANSDVNISAVRMDNKQLPENAKKAIGNRPVFDLSVNYGNEKYIRNFGSGNISVEIPYTLGEDEKPENVFAVYVDENGTLTWLNDCVYDSEKKAVVLNTNHLSIYGVAYKEETPKTTETINFTDIKNHWAEKDILFVVNRGLFSGTSDTTFGPNTAMTRGMFVTTLGRLAEADVSEYETSSFSDVKSDVYYMGYIEWANKNNIVKGFGDNKFAPDEPITREQMAVIMQNYANAIGTKLPTIIEGKIFADDAEIATWAKDAVKFMQMEGIISGKEGNSFDPKGTATRAEVSTVLKGFVEL